MDMFEEEFLQRDAAESRANTGAADGEATIEELFMFLYFFKT